MKTDKIISQNLLETLKASDLRMIAYLLGKKNGIGCLYLNLPKDSLRKWSFKKLLFLNIIQIHSIQSNVAYFKMHPQYSEQKQYKFNLITGKYKEPFKKMIVNQDSSLSEKIEHIPLSWGSIT